jgi:hypothetical protein
MQTSFFSENIQLNSASGSEQWNRERAKYIGASEINNIKFLLGITQYETVNPVYNVLKKLTSIMSSTEKHVIFSLGHLFEKYTTMLTTGYLFKDSANSFVNADNRYLNKNFKSLTCTPDLLGSISVESLENLRLTDFDNYLKRKNISRTKKCPITGNEIPNTLKTIFEFKYATNKSSIKNTRILFEYYHHKYISQMLLEQVLLENIDLCLYIRLYANIYVPYFNQQGISYGVSFEYDNKSSTKFKEKKDYATNFILSFIPLSLITGQSNLTDSLTDSLFNNNFSNNLSNLNSPSNNSNINFLNKYFLRGLQIPGTTFQSPHIFVLSEQSTLKMCEHITKDNSYMLDDVNLPDFFNVYQKDLIETVQVQKSNGLETYVEEIPIPKLVFIISNVDMCYDFMDTTLIGEYRYKMLQDELFSFDQDFSQKSEITNTYLKNIYNDSSPESFLALEELFINELSKVNVKKTVLDVDAMLCKSSTLSAYCLDK